MVSLPFFVNCLKQLLLMLFRSVWSVGCGLGGKLGHGTRSDERFPKEIVHFKDIKFEPVAVAAGAWHAVALSSDGRVATWGWGRHGCLGHGSDQCETVPRVVDCLAGSLACHVAAGDYTTFVVGRRGEVWSFGSTESACLGHNSEGPNGAGAAEEEGDEDVQLHEAAVSDGIILAVAILSFALFLCLLQ